MFGTFTTLVTLGLALNPVGAGVYITSPVSSTAAVGGQVLNVKWADDGKTPTVASIGPCSIDLYTGSMDVQTKLQNLAANVDVSKASSVSATIDPSVGQSGAYYFVRFSSLGLHDTTNPQYMYEAFSAIFSINAMTGQFNQTVLAAISATGAAPVVASTGSATAAGAGAGAVAVVTSTTTPSSSSKASTTAKYATTSGSTSGAFSVAALPTTLLMGTMAVVSFFAL